MNTRKLLAMVLFVFGICVSTQAQFRYVTNSDGASLTITGYAGPYPDVTIPSSINGLPVVGIGAYALAYPGFASITIPSSVTNIQDNACSDDPSLTTVTFSDGPLVIGNSSFAGCYNLSSINLPTGLASIGANAFNGTGLQSVQIPATVTNIGADAFGNCQQLVRIDVSSGNPEYNSGPYVPPLGGSYLGILFTKDLSTLVQFPAGMQPGTGFGESWPGNYVVPNSVTQIASGAFDGCAMVYSVEITNGLVSIGDDAFGNSGLEAIQIPNSVTNIGTAAFSYCRNLNSIRIPDGVTTLSNSLFYECTMLGSVTLPRHLSSIGMNAFYGCPIQSITLPDTVTNLGASCFDYCSSLRSLFFAGDAPVADPTAFSGVSGTIYYLPGRNGWTSPFDGLTAVLWNPATQPTDPTFGVRNGNFGFTITGTANIPFVLEASTNVSGGSWSSVMAGTLTNGSVYFSDANWQNKSNCFYRIRSP